MDCLIRHGSSWPRSKNSSRAIAATIREPRSSSGVASVLGRSPVGISLPPAIQVNICSQAFLALSSALSEVSEFVMPSEWHVSPTEPLSRAVAPLVQTNGARSGGQMVVSWTLFRAASQESGLSGLEIGARPDEAVTRFETGSAIETRVNQDRAPTCMSGNEGLRYTSIVKTSPHAGICNATRVRSYATLSGTAARHDLIFLRVGELTAR